VFNLTSIAEAQKEIKNTDEHAEQQRELTKNILTLTKRFVKDSANMKVFSQAHSWQYVHCSLPIWHLLNFLLDPSYYANV
jgi:hypothetical protein